jgi:hypothetical protein
LAIAVVTAPLAEMAGTPAANNLLVPTVVSDCAIFFLGFGFIGRKRRRTKSVLASQLLQTMADAVQAQLEAEHPFIFWETEAALCMDAKGHNLRLFALGQHRSEIETTFTIAVADIVSIELVKHEDTVGEATTITKKKGALGRAAVGELIFGPTGAIVGSISAGSKSTTVTHERRVYRFSELVFGLSDFRHPVVRFASTDHEECERWLYRIRAAMTKSAASKGPT